MHKRRRIHDASLSKDIIVVNHDYDKRSIPSDDELPIPIWPPLPTTPSTAPSLLDEVSQVLMTTPLLAPVNAIIRSYLASRYIAILSDQAGSLSDSNHGPAAGYGEYTLHLVNISDMVATRDSQQWCVPRHIIGARPNVTEPPIHEQLPVMVYHQQQLIFLDSGDTRYGKIAPGGYHRLHHHRVKLFDIKSSTFASSRSLVSHQAITVGGYCDVPIPSFMDTEYRINVSQLIMDDGTDMASVHIISKINTQVRSHHWITSSVPLWCDGSRCFSLPSSFTSILAFTDDDSINSDEYTPDDMILVLLTPRSLPAIEAAIISHRGTGSDLIYHRLSWRFEPSIDISSDSTRVRALEVVNQYIIMVITSRHTTLVYRMHVDQLFNGTWQLLMMIPGFVAKDRVAVIPVA